MESRWTSVTFPYGIQYWMVHVDDIDTTGLSAWIQYWNPYSVLMGPGRQSVGEIGQRPRK